MKKIVVEYAERWSNGGIEAYILNIIKHIDKTRFDIKIVVAQKETDIYDKELRACNCEIIEMLPQIVSNPIWRMLKNRKYINAYLKSANCDILHMHICQGVALSYAKLAKKYRVKKVIAHCHNTSLGQKNKTIKMLGHILGKIYYAKYVDKCVACSDLAADWLFKKGKKLSGEVSILNGIIDVDKFKFSEFKRDEFRNKYDIDNSQKVYLNIGRLSYQKNHLFLIDIFTEILQKDSSSVFIIIGAGELEEEIKNYAKERGLFEKIIFIAKTREIASYMSMSDVFILPSLFEGNPIVGIEAQANGLPCVFSSTITKMAKLLDNTKFIKIDETAEKWAQEITKIPILSQLERRKMCDYVKCSGYDIDAQIKQIENLYEDLEREIIV